jgi:hypothetical protein
MTDETLERTELVVQEKVNRFRAESPFSFRGITWWIRIPGIRFTRSRLSAYLNFKPTQILPGLPNDTKRCDISASNKAVYRIS